MSAPARKRVDVAIVGGGMVGMSLAHILARALPHKKICVLEKHPLATHADASNLPSFDARCSALSVGTVDVLQALSLWKGVVDHATAIQQVHVSDRGHVGHVEYSENHKPLGYIVPNGSLGETLLRQLPVEVLAPAEVRSLTFKSAGALLDIHSSDMSFPTTIESDLVVIADGAASRLRQKIGIGADRFDYQQHAVIANIEFTERHQGRAYERFTADGPMAVLPCGGQDNPRLAALVWTRPSEKLKATLSLDDKDFSAAVQASFGYRLGRLVKVGERSHYPLHRVLAHEQVRSSVVILGNAAHLLHPVAGQGFNLALRDAMQLAETLADASNQGERLGELAVLRRYLELQSRDQQLTTAISHNFNRLFSHSGTWAQAARNFGLLSMELMRAPKQAFFQTMMGRGQKQVQLDFMRESHYEY